MLWQQAGKNRTPSNRQDTKEANTQAELIKEGQYGADRAVNNSIKYQLYLNTDLADAERTSLVEVQFTFKR